MRCGVSAWCVRSALMTCKLTCIIFVGSLMSAPAVEVHWEYCRFMHCRRCNAISSSFRCNQICKLVCKLVSCPGASCHRALAVHAVSGFFCAGGSP